eukprot:CAMPEP_0118976484 /NCGR_PEP_ID=MMETSP1173-20130426/18970_1 /TAXON_ID=1034831 /ORGANISM="Rhizochromulina marina cf, Strain CCMP1243" /LENGTH=473 /DNA_ID=CAMNT_0006926525 /DNA_START=54 /DNA_END=1475 /DNA_ORIENTATION=-
MDNWRRGALLVVCLCIPAAGDQQPPPLRSQWSTEDLDWTHPSNVTILDFTKAHPLQWPRALPLMLRVYDDEECAAADVDDERYLWWAEVRRHAPLEEAIQVGQIYLNNLPAPLNAEKIQWKAQTVAQGTGCRSCVLFIPAGSDGSDFSLAPVDMQGMRPFVDWIRERMRIGCDVRNSFDFDLVLYWVDDSTEEHRITDIAAGETLPQHTFIGHVFVARAKDDGRLVDWWSMSGGPLKVVEDRAQTVETQCHAETQECQSAEEALFDYIYTASFTKRHALNTVQPSIVHNYTARGFIKMPVPEATFAWLKAWYDKNGRQEVEETNAGAVGTQHEAPWFVRHVPPNLKTRLASELRPIMAEWSGFEDGKLAMTSCYGIRRYSRGAQLRMHVDTMTTHVVSAIINVDQEIDSDWPIEIKNHEGVYEYVNMKPGEMLFYESAKCLHGRPQKFNGDGYSNIFLHFQPTDSNLWPYDWY